MSKKFLLGGLALVVLLGAGCKKSEPTPEVQVERDQKYSDDNTGVTFMLPDSLRKDKVVSEQGSVSMKLVKNSEEGLLDNVTFSTKTRDAWLNEMVKAKLQDKKVCESEEQFGCEKWDENVAIYNKAIKENNFDGYYAMGTNKVVVNNIPFVVAVTYNLANQQYQTKYVAYVNNTRITFIDPAAGGLEYGIPFQMNAKNREVVESTAQKIAKRERVDDVKTRARADALYQLVSTVKIK